MRTLVLITFIFPAMTSFSQDQEPSNKHFWHTVSTTAQPAQVWDIWTDVAHWHEWDSGLSAAAMDEPFALDARGVITSLEGRKSKFKVVEYERGSSYTFKTNLPLGGLYVKRFLEEKNGTTFLTHEVWFKGLTSGLFAKAFGKKFREMLPGVVEKVRERAEA